MAVLKCLGTSAYIPTKARDNTSFLFSYQGNSFLVDCPGAISHKLLKTDFDFKKIKQVIITHQHPDHIYGIISLIHTQLSFTDKLTIFSSNPSIKIIKQLVKMFKLDKPGFPRINYVNVFEKNYFFQKNNLKAKAVRNVHTKDSFGVYFIFGKKKFFYSSDAAFSLKMLNTIKTTDYLMHDCTASSSFFKKYPQLYKSHTCSLQLKNYLIDKLKIVLIPVHFLLADKKEMTRIRKELSPLKKVIFLKDYQSLNL